MINLKQHTNISLLYFLIVGLLGLFLRLFFVTPITANFRHIVHAHSHIALLGWVYLALATLIYKMYFNGLDTSRKYKKIFWFTNFTILGMLFTFPFTGYALYSIIFSTLFLFASYLFSWFVFKNIPASYKNTSSYKCIKFALWYLVISSIGPWAIGGVMATLGNTSIWYKLSIYFYLHFQYNAWFILALMGIFLYIPEKAGIKIDAKLFSKFFQNFNQGLILSVFLSALWVKPPAIFYLFGAAGAIFQLIGLVYFFQIIRRHRRELKNIFSPQVLFLLKFAALFLGVKVLLQLLTAIPYFAELSYHFPDFVIGYLHLTFLGIISVALFAFLIFFRLLKMPPYVWWLYLTGFMLSEFLIFYKGMALWQEWDFLPHQFKILFGISALLPVAVGILLFKNLRSAEG